MYNELIQHPIIDAGKSIGGELGNKLSLSRKLFVIWKSDKKHIRIGRNCFMIRLAATPAMIVFL